MKGLLYYKTGDIRYSEDVEEPEILSSHDVKIRVKFCGICGTDLKEYTYEGGPLFLPKPGSSDKISGLELPLCPGHEFCGVVEEVGESVTRVKPGDRVAVEATTHCSDAVHYGVHDMELCVACKNGSPNCCTHLSFCGLGGASGGFAEKVVYGEEHMLKLPDSIPFDIGALIEPLAVAWHAVECAKFKPGSTALVLGGGPIGLATILALQGHQAGRIVCSEPACIRREYAAKFGAEVFDPSQHDDVIHELKALLPENGGFDASFDCSGVPQTFTTSIEALAPGGMAVNVAIWGDHAIDFGAMCLTYQEKTCTGSMCYTVKDFEEVINALDKGLISISKARLMITGKVNLKDGVELGFKQLIEHKETNIKILVTPDEV
uniref:Glycerol dehydrogenase n=1 Tax=Zygoascus ofunaensis TaxID=45509 RepID=Q1T714_9ASCO|nr:glycerol dehydrogenase [Zygoascus ofunaensis]